MNDADDDLLHPLLSARWSPTTFAGLLVANRSHRFVEDSDWDYSEFCAYDHRSSTGPSSPVVDGSALT